MVLLLHGFPDCWLTWREQFQSLAEHYRYIFFTDIYNAIRYATFECVDCNVRVLCRFRVVALDLKGFGDSDKPFNKRLYKVEIIVDELKQFILALGVKTCSIIGHDLGGLLGWYMVALHGDIVYKFVAISSPHPNLYWNRGSRNSTLDKKWVCICEYLRDYVFVLSQSAYI